MMLEMACDRDCAYTGLYSVLCFIFVSSVGSRVATATSHAPGQAPGSCVSQGGRFPPFVNEGKLPRKSFKGPDDLTLCRVYSKKTCCTSSQTRAALNSLKRLASNGEANSRCLELWEVLECAICDPHIGTQPGPPVLCKDFCESIFSSCADAFFAIESTNRILMPCGPKDTICAQAKEWTANALTFCQLLGFTIEAANQEPPNEVAFCFDGREVVDLSPKQSLGIIGKATQEKDYSQISLGRLFLLFGQAETDKKILWAIGGLVLTAGAAILRHRRLKRRYKRAALFRSIQQARARQEAANNAATSKAANRTSSRTAKKTS